MQQALLDHAFSLYSNHNGFFKSGWGKHDVLEHIVKLGSKKLTTKLARRKIPLINIEWSATKTTSHCKIQEGHFISPYQFNWKNKGKNQIEKLPEESQLARFQLVSPNQSNKDTPLIIHFAATGDEGYAIRTRFMARPLVKQRVASLLLENPFYGSRRPGFQTGTLMQRVTDFLQMSRAVQDEGLALLDWFYNQGYTRLGVAGVSMGAYMAMSVAAQTRVPISIVACLPTHSASAPYTEGTYSRACDWNTLSKELSGNRNPKETMAMIFDLANLCSMPVPSSVDSAILIGAKKDAYIPLSSTIQVHNHWKGSELRWINSGHIGSILFHNKRFVEAVLDSIQKKYN